jgi:hypothetical protein
MPTVTQLLDRASQVTGLRSTGSERQIALDALNDVYMDILLQTEVVERQWVHTFTDRGRDFDLEQYNENSTFTRIADEAHTFTGAGSTVNLANSPINGAGVLVTSDPSGTTYVEGTDFTVDPTAGTVTHVAGGAIGDTDPVLISYFLPPTGTFNDDIMIPPNLKIKSVVYQEANSSLYPLFHVSEGEILEYRRGFEAISYTRMYALAGANMLRLFPSPGRNETLTITYVPMPPLLSETDDRPAAMWDTAVFDLSQFGDWQGSETSPSLIPLQFQWNVLLSGAVVQLLEKDQRLDDAMYWRAKYEEGIAKMHLWHNTYGGEPTPIFDKSRPRFVAYPDEYGRI